MSKLRRLDTKQAPHRSEELKINMSKVELSDELIDADLQLVNGGADPNYKFCWNGPAGTGTYPNYVDCDTPTWGQIFQAWVNVGNMGKQM
jgi:hypothetical protein